MRRRRGFAADGSLDFQGRIFSSVVLRQQGKVGGRHFQSAGGGTSAFAVDAMANGTLGRVHLLAGRGRRALHGNMLDGFLWGRRLAALHLTLSGDGAGAYDQNSKQQNQFSRGHRILSFQQARLVQTWRAVNQEPDDTATLHFAAVIAWEFSNPGPCAPEQAWPLSGLHDRSRHYIY